jgi:hypothetical protein
MLCGPAQACFTAVSWSGSGKARFDSTYDLSGRGAHACNYRSGDRLPETTPGRPITHASDDRRPALPDWPFGARISLR